jgi:NAD(P)-dependent dehydrogenase (short-subunit alcohol dehydrogenase family)
VASVSYPVAGRVVLVTGAARGIGLDAVQRLHARGANVALVGLEPELLEQRASELGERAAWFECDVTHQDTLQAAVDGTVARFGGLDVVIANAGVAPVGTVLTIDPADFERTIEVNLLGVWRTIRAALPHVVQRRGYVLPIASLAAAVHAPLMAPYTASKAAVEAFADSLRAELAPTGTKVGCAYFGFIDTDMVREARDHPATRSMRSRPGGPDSAVPVGVAGEAIARGVERRARWVYAPRWVPAVLYARGLLTPLYGRLARDPRVRESIRIAEEQPRGPGSGDLAPSRTPSESA